MKKLGKLVDFYYLYIYKSIKIIAQHTADKITEIYCIVDDFRKEFSPDFDAFS